MPETKRPLKVFLCHAHADRDPVRGLYNHLTQDSVDAWLDKAKLLPGQDWELEIRKAVREADVVVVCLSKQFNQAGFRQKEVRWALETAMEQPEGEIYIIPARLEECDTLESLKKFHWVDLFEDGGYDRLVLALAVRAQKVHAELRIEKERAIEKKQLAVYQEAENTIGLSTDLRFALMVVLRNIMRRIDIDAATILLFDPKELILQCAAEIGFLSYEIIKTSSRLGEGASGKSALERKTIRIANLALAGTEFNYWDLLIQEKFVSYMAVPLISKGEIKGVLEIFQRSALKIDDEKKSVLDVLASQTALTIDSALSFEEREKANLKLTTYDATIAGWSRALEQRDKELHGHTSRVVDLVLRFAQSMGLHDSALQDIWRGAQLHDIGKMGIPDEILHKQGKLSEDEWKIMQKHPQYAYEMLAPIAYLRNSLDIPYCHHEKWDGTGYPRGLKGEEIPLSARIFAVVDVYDMLTTDKPYRKTFSKGETLAYIQEQAGKHFDPQVVKAFIKLMKS